MDLSIVPRSIRWRIQLGVYQGVDPSMFAAEQQPLDTLSTKELLDLIYNTNKDTIRQQNERFESLLEKYVEEEVEEEHPGAAATGADDKTTEPAAAPEIDPLTAMVMEQQAIETHKAELLLKYKKERARRKRGLTTEGRHIGDESDGIDRASLVIIEKDLKRLPHPTSNNGAASAKLSPDEETRIANLKEILYIYAQEHPAMGYRQGMHEIASYLLYALELEQPQFPNNPLFDSILPICFALLENTLDHLHLAYDASGEQSLQKMSHSILSKIHQNDATLYKHLTTSPHIPPPPIYCTRWVRLLFSREVVGFENVFRLWDVFFEYKTNVMRALEVTSAARILLLRDALLNPENSPLDLLMNVPQLRDTSPLTSLLKQLMEQKDSDKPIQLPASQMMLPPPQTPQKMPGTSPPMTTPQTATHSQGPIAHSSSMESTPNNKGMSNSNKNFSFSKMAQSLGQKSESIRKKITTATNEWKRESSGGSSQYSVSADMFASAGEAIRQGTYNLNPTETVIFNDPSTSSPHGSMPAPPSPRKHQHARWSQGLNERLLVVQNYLMAVESSEENSSKVPPEVWEAMAAMQRMQQELHNYSINMS